MKIFEGIKKHHRLIVSILIILFAIQVLWSMSYKTMEYDEVFHPVRGYTVLKLWDFRLDVGHPPLVQMISALPWLFIGPEIPTDHPSWVEEGQNDFASFGHEFFFVRNKDKWFELLTWARIPIMIIGMLLGLIVFLWAKHLFGIIPGIAALTLFVFNPEMIAYSRFSGTDMGFDAALLLLLFLTYLYLRKPNMRMLVLTSLSFGLCFLTKFTIVVFLPVYVIFILLLAFIPENGPIKINLKIISRKIRLIAYSLILFGITAVLLINIQYGFQESFTSISDSFAKDKYHAEYDINDFIPFQSPILRKATEIMLNIPVPLPYRYVRSLGLAVHQSQLPHHGFLAGKYQDYGFWYYYIFNLSVKSPLPLILLFGIALYFNFKNNNNKNRLLWILLATIILAIFQMSFTNEQVGIRHITHVIPLMIIFISPLFAPQFFRKNKKTALICCILLVWYIMTAIAIFPHHESFFNIMAGGPSNGYNLISDSSIDWGQNYFFLKDYLEENKIKNISIAYFAPTNIEDYGITNFILLKSVVPHFMQSDLPCNPVHGKIAISVDTYRNLRVNGTRCYSWLDNYVPSDLVAYSILIYDI